jgi:nucleotide-binding universal stress UspA family protein
MLIHVVEKNAPSAVHSDRHLVTAQEATAYLDELTRRPPLAGLAVATHVHTAEVRDVARSITEHTDELAPDLVVMTTHGTGGARRLFSGAIAQQVVGHGLTPVLLVHPPEDGAVSGRAALSAEARPWTSILAPIDGDPVHEKSLPIAADLAVAFGCRLHLLMVTHTSASLAGTDHATETFLPGATRIKLEMESAAAQEYLETRSRELSERGIETGAEASRGDPALAIIKAARRISPDLVVMATHGRAGAGAFFEGSVAARVVARARASLLLVPVKE